MVLFYIVTKMVTTQNKIRKSKVSKKIIEKLRIKKNKILSKHDIFEIIKEYEQIYKKKINLISLWTYLRKDKYIKRILWDYYYVFSLEERHNHYCKFSEEELVFLVLEKIKIKWYLGLERALIENKISWQVLNVIIIINNRYSGIKKLGNSKFRFIKTKDEMFNFGLTKDKTNNNVIYFYSDLEKTYLDFLHFYSYKGKDIESIRKNLDFRVKQRKLVKYAKNYSKKIKRLSKKWFQ